VLRSRFAFSCCRLHNNVSSDQVIQSVEKRFTWVLKTISPSSSSIYFQNSLPPTTMANNSKKRKEPCLDEEKKAGDVDLQESEKKARLLPSPFAQGMLEPTLLRVCIGLLESAQASTFLPSRLSPSTTQRHGSPSDLLVQRREEEEEEEPYEDLSSDWYSLQDETEEEKQRRVEHVRARRAGKTCPLCIHDTVLVSTTKTSFLTLLLPRFRENQPLKTSPSLCNGRRATRLLWVSSRRPTAATPGTAFDFPHA
jgi:hypothetical protein